MRMAAGNRQLPDAQLERIVLAPSSKGCAEGRLCRRGATKGHLLEGGVQQGGMCKGVCNRGSPIGKGHACSTHLLAPSRSKHATGMHMGMESASHKHLLA